MGDASLSRRPMKRVIDPLTTMGAQIASQDGHAPLRITGTQLKGIEYQPPVASAQVKTCLLFAGLLEKGRPRSVNTHPTRDHGELALRAFGAEVERAKGSVAIAGGQALHPLDAYIPGDSSSAAFFLCAAAIFPNRTW